jgi:pantoate--beta-alanine ligase
MRVIKDFRVAMALSTGGVGLVPTMGALHEGHLSLIRTARSQCDKVIVSILVNPLQFGPNEDFASYPRTLEKDLALCEAEGVDVVFCPDYREIYPEGFATRVHGGELVKAYCGVTRPIFFEGVLTVVNILLNIIRPDKAYFGEKDYQQLFLIRQMVRDLRMPIEVVDCPIIRESSGLAMSSRNTYLTAQQQGDVNLFRGLLAAQEAFQLGERNAEKLLELAREKITLEIDYLKLVSERTLREIQGVVTEPARMLVAAYTGINPRVRLIDNLKI